MNCSRYSLNKAYRQLSIVVLSSNRQINLVSKLMDERDQAIKRKDREKLTELLERWKLWIKQSSSSPHSWAECGAV
jgi:hypothetical protein